MRDLFFTGKLKLENCLEKIKNLLISKNGLVPDDEELSDQTRIGNTAWVELKEHAMDKDLQQQSWFVSSCL